MFKTLLVSSLSVIFIQCQAQKKTSSRIKINEYHSLPASCNESSGLEYVNDKFLSINDKGNTEEIFVFNKKGKFSHTVTLTNAQNTDWEDITSNSKYVFVGDIGNNNRNRKKLTIYALPIEKISEKEASAQEIHFRYGSQTSYEKSERNHPYDAESLFALEDELIIISKDWTYSNTWLYRLPIRFGDTVHTLSPVEVVKWDALITGADFDPDSQTIALCGYKGKTNFLWIGKSENGKFLQTHFYLHELDKLEGAQVEGITFKDSKTLLISTEISKKFAPQVWEIRLP